MSEERREFSRVEVGMWANVVLSGDTIEGPVANLSMNGLFIHMDGKIPKLGQSGHLRLVLGQGCPPLEVRADVEVMRVTPEGIGLQILEVELESYHHLRQVLLHNAPDPRAVEGELKRHLGLRRA